MWPKIGGTIMYSFTLSHIRSLKRLKCFFFVVVVYDNCLCTQSVYNPQMIA